MGQILPQMYIFVWRRHSIHLKTPKAHQIRENVERNNHVGAAPLWETEIATIFNGSFELIGNEIQRNEEFQIISSYLIFGP